MSDPGADPDPGQGDPGADVGQAMTRTSVCYVVMLNSFMQNIKRPIKSQNGTNRTLVYYFMFCEIINQQHNMHPDRTHYRYSLMYLL